jgi:ABC-type molybdate transport system substrate-binding protein
MVFAFACALNPGTLSAQTASPGVYAAGSLRLAFDNIVALHAARTGTRYVPTYGILERYGFK